MSRFTFGEVEAVLAELNRIASDKRVAFGARVKNLQKQGLKTSRGSPGKGRVARYTYVEVVELAVGIELLRLGIPPQRAASIVSKSSNAFCYTAYLATYTYDEAMAAATERGIDLPELYRAWLIRYDALADMTVYGHHETDDWEAVETVELSKIKTIFEIGAFGGDDEIDGVPRRHLAINGSALCRRIVEIAAHRFLFATPEEMREDILEELRRVTDGVEDLKAFAEKLKREKNASS